MPFASIDWLAAVNERMRRRPAWFLLAFLIVNGVHGTDAHDFAILAARPFALHPDVERQFMHSSPLTFLIGAPLARLVGVDAAFPMVSAAGFLLVAFALTRFLRRFPAREAETIGIVLLSSPLLLVLTRWIGKSDPFLVAFYLLLAADPRSPLTKGALATAIVLCHREIGTIVLGVHLVLFRRDAVPVLAGLAAGHAALLAYLFELLPAPPRSRAQFAEGRALELLEALSMNPIVHIAFALNWFWIFLAIHLGRSRERVTAVALLIVFVAATVAFDFTRVMAVCALPIIVHVAVRLAPDAPPLLASGPFPLLFLAQFQIEGAGWVHDWSWLR